MTTRKNPLDSEAAALTEAARDVELTSKKLVGRFYELQQEVVPPEPYQLTEDVAIMPLTRRRNVALLEATTHEEADRAFFGDAYDAVVALYDDRPLAEYDALVADLRKHWMGKTVEDVPGK